MTLKQLITDSKNGRLQLDAKDVYQAHLVAEHSMCQYMTEKRFMAEFGDLYKQAREILAQRKNIFLPRQMRLNLIPGGALACAPMNDEVELIERMRELSILEKSISEEQKSFNPSKTKSGAHIRVDQTRIKKLSEERMAAVKEAAKSAAENKVISQYDLINGKKLAPEDYLDQISLKTLSNVIKVMKEVSR
jgi:hypothetical protein